MERRRSGYRQAGHHECFKTRYFFWQSQLTTLRHEKSRRTPGSSKLDIAIAKCCHSGLSFLVNRLMTCSQKRVMVLLQIGTLIDLQTLPSWTGKISQDNIFPKRYANATYILLGCRTIQQLCHRLLEPNGNVGDLRAFMAHCLMLFLVMMTNHYQK